jgi:hypothetical protein
MDLLLCLPVEKPSFLRLPPNEQYALFYQALDEKRSVSESIRCGAATFAVHFKVGRFISNSLTGA